ncbi:sigma-54-dependent Fis family transcriptional regulator [Pseudomonas typographi]|uniref:Sigma-54-dependent Fis family transcriptional regulator n=1 Tax=Pseudomonas typographi TaxID=2715964 RepID=A0ABR7Z4W5_9PSED|nr:sigma-54-dependent Fis family transcriptional regulator [Pseudomonas typographi]MBD1600556.1 sigma-54-dependent Fis family transcriptional regulator [Pseudomonas typographi]
MHSDHLSRHARHVLTVAHGQAPDPASDPSIARSWRRCLLDYRLDPTQALAPSVLEHGRVLEARERLRHVLQVADGEMNQLHQQLCGAGHAVLLTDTRGVILNCITAASERRVFEQAGLWLGADWSEASEGTNGIGTCLVERQAVSIHQAEHFRGRHTGLTCSASPVFDPAGELLAVLDVSSAREQVSRQHQFHTMTLVNLAAKTIENAYFLRHFEQHWLLRFHLQAEPPGSFSEGLLAFDEAGRVLAANPSGLNLLRLPRSAVLGHSVEALFDCRLGELFARACQQPTARWPLYQHGVRTLYGCVRGAPPLAQRIPLARPSSQVAPAAGAWCLADGRVAEQLRRALKVYEHDVPLLIQGETGSGKEAFARALHGASRRVAEPFVALNCAAIPENLIESELFGYRPGSFTGAHKHGMRGKLLEADGGTLLLDEIGDMPLALQTRLLRVLEDRQVVPIGGTPQPLDVRIISATHQDLGERVANGEFREDLYYRLNGLAIELPPLRERSDKAELIEHLLGQLAPGTGLRLAGPAREALLAYAWPGNVRQLKTVLRTLAALCEGGVIRLQDVPAHVREQQAQVCAPAPLADAERTALVKVLDQERWHMTRVAQRLGISRNTLYRKLHRHGLAR